MISGRAWRGLREIFNRRIPSIVTIDYLVEELKLPSGDGANSNIIAPLTQMGIIDDKGKPTDRAYKWRDDREYRAVCEEIINEIYPHEIKKMLSSGENKDNMISWLMLNNQVGKSSATKVLYTLFLLHEGIPEKEASKINKPTEVKKLKGGIENNPPKKIETVISKGEDEPTPPPSVMNNESTKVEQPVASVAPTVSVNNAPTNAVININIEIDMKTWSHESVINFMRIIKGGL